MTDLDQVLAKLSEMEAALKVNRSPWFRGDRAAADYAGYKTTRAFRAWAREAGIKPSIEGKLNFWSRADIDAAREKSRG